MNGTLRLLASTSADRYTTRMRITATARATHDSPSRGNFGRLSRPRRYRTPRSPSSRPRRGSRGSGPECGQSSAAEFFLRLFAPGATRRLPRALKPAAADRPVWHAPAGMDNVPSLPRSRDRPGGSQATHGASKRGRCLTRELGRGRPHAVPYPLLPVGEREHRAFEEVLSNPAPTRAPFAQAPTRFAARAAHVFAAATRTHLRCRRKGPLTSRARRVRHRRPP